MKKLTLILAAMVLTASQAFGQCGKCGYEVKAENAYTNYNVRYASNPMDAKHYTTDRLRSEFAIEKVFAPGEVNWTYTMFDRFLIGGAEPTTAPLKLTSIAPLYTDKPNDQKNLLDNRELGIINIGGEGTVTVDGKKYTLGFQEALYVGRGAAPRHQYAEPLRPTETSREASCRSGLRERKTFEHDDQHPEPRR